ncbi:unnamed protein product [Candidula unifasciata]|uniref:G-protein coupled receptors family 1 profile domain-containing protein n=1 Tax=Candidula unifasciata TaxID=100452 RepID=A0A8S3YUF2_9EUPU|nr:unnamed protein product [Candidula unifasciata]
MSDNNGPTFTNNQTSAVTWDSSAKCHLVPYYIHACTGIFVACVALFSGVGNSLVLYTFARHSSLRTSSNLLIINLTVADLLMSLLNLPVFAVSSLTSCWRLGYVGCQIYGFTSSICSLVTINTLVAISVDRYIVVVHRHCRMHRLAKSTTGFIIAAIWTLSITWSVLPLAGLGLYRLEGMGTSCTFNYVDRSVPQRWFFLCLVTCNFLVPVTMITYCYWRIYLRVKHVRQELKFLLRDYSHGAMRQLGSDTQSEMRTAFTAMVIIGIFCAAWAPYVIISFVGLFGPENSLTPMIAVIPNILAKVSTVFNPILYTIGHPEVRKKLLSLIFSSQRTLRQPVITTSVSPRSDDRVDKTHVFHPHITMMTHKMCKVTLSPRIEEDRPNRTAS